MALLNCYILPEIINLFPYYKISEIFVEQNVIDKDVKKEVLRAFNYKQKTLVRFIKPYNIFLEDWYKIGNIPHMRNSNNYCYVLIFYSAQTNNLLGMKWALKKWFDCSSDSCWLSLAFNYACVNENIKMAEWLIDLSNNLSSIKIHSGFYNNFLNVCEYGHLEFAKWILNAIKNSRECDLTQSGYMFDDALNVSCRGGNLEIAKWLIFECEIKNMHNAMDGACTGGHLEIAKWIIDIIINDVSTIPLYCRFNGIFLRSALLNACFYGHLEIAKWIVALSIKYSQTEHLDTKLIVDDFNEALNTACQCGRFKFVKWLIEECGANNIVDGFYYACGCGKIKIVKWIISSYYFKLKNQDLNKALKNSLNNQHMKMYRWLCKLKKTKFKN